MINFRKFLKEEFFDVSIPNKGFKRSQLAQIRQHEIAAFTNYLSRKKIAFEFTQLRACDIKFGQKHIDRDKLANLDISKINKNDVLLCSIDNFLLDGHHRVFKLKMVEPTRNLYVCRINLNYEQLNDIAKEFRIYEKL